MRPPRSAKTVLLPALPRLAVGLALCLALAGCSPNINILGGPASPYKEQTLSGSGSAKVLLVSVDGLITERTREGFLRTRPSTVEDIAAQLKLARLDANIKALVLKVDSPGGTTTASDVIHHELMAYKAETKVKMVAVLMGLGTSGGYYVALPADHIMALPTTITGSVGVVFLMPRVAGLLEKIGVGVDVSKSGTHKDMGSPFRNPTPEETRLVDDMVKAQAARFLDLVQERRRLAPADLRTAATARVFTAAEAKELGLVDSIGYMEDGLAMAASLAGLPKDARVVSYRRRPGPDATYYQPSAEGGGQAPALIHLGLENLLPHQAGLYSLWTPGLEQ